MPKLVGITAISAIIILTIGILPPPQNNNNDITFTNVQGFDTEPEFFELDNLDNLNEFELDNLQEIEFSIIDSERVFTESNQSLIEQFLDENDLPSSSEKFGIETQVALFDSDNEVYNSSDVFGIPQLSVTDDEGRVLDLGTIQVTFEGISKQKETTTDIWGTVEFFLDDTKVDSKYIWGSGSNSDRLTLSLLDSLSVTDNIAVAPSFSAQEKKNHTFTLSDEGRDWIDGSEHTYRVVITKIHANLNSDKDFKEFQWTGQHIAYELKVKVDQSKKIILNEDNEAISIFKNDSTIQIGTQSTYHTIRYVNVQGTVYSNPPTVTVTDTMGKRLLTKADTTFSSQSGSLTGSGGVGGVSKCYAKHCYGTATTTSFSPPIAGIPRDSDIIIKLTRDGETKSYEVHTPKSQFNYFIEHKPDKSGSGKCVAGSGSEQYKISGVTYSKCKSNVFVTTPIFEVFSSNFGYNSDDTIWASSIIRTP